MIFVSTVMRHLLADHDLRLVDRMVYVAAATHQAASVSGLAEAAGLSRTAVTGACANLERTGWLRLVRRARALAPEAIWPDRIQAELASRFEIEYELAVNKGEFLMKRYLDLRVSSDEFVDNARPAFLSNPLTSESLEYDRFYLAGVAFEFNGPQHYRATQRYSSDKDLRDTRARDLMKHGLSQHAQVTLVSLTAEQLHPPIFDQFIPKQLPVRSPDVGGAYYQTVARICANYAARARGSGQ